MEKQLKDPIRPDYYKGFNKIVNNNFTLEQQIIITEFQIYKYLYRYKEKNGIEDLKKARWYLNKLISKTRKFIQEHSNLSDI